MGYRSKNQIIIALILFLLLFGDVCAATFPLPLCGRQDFFFYNASSDLSGYRALKNIPELDGQRQIASASITSTSGEATLGTWVSPPFESTTVLAPGGWDFQNYFISSSSSGNTYARYRVFNLTPAGVKTYFWFGNAIEKGLTSGTVPAEYELSYARRNYTTFFAGDRLGVQINVSTDSASARTVTMELAGNTNASMFSNAYWLCSSTSSSASLSHSSPPPSVIPINVYIPLVGVVCAVFLLGRRR